MNRLILSSRAEADLTQAFQWYEAQRAGLGHEFIASVDELLGRISRAPGAWRVRRRGVRCALARRFPYIVFYVWDLTDEAVVVRRVVHAHRDFSILGME